MSHPESKSDLDVPDSEVRPEQDMRNWYVTMRMIDLPGATETCQACQAMKTGRENTGVSHSNVERSRVWRCRKANEDGTHWLANQLETTHRLWSRAHLRQDLRCFISSVEDSERKKARASSALFVQKISHIDIEVAAVKNCHAELFCFQSAR